MVNPVGVKYYKELPSRENFNNKIRTTKEPGFCTECHVQFRKGEEIYFDGGKDFTFTIGPTFRNRYIIHEGIKKEHAEPTCEEACEREYEEIKEISAGYEMVSESHLSN